MDAIVLHKDKKGHIEWLVIGCYQDHGGDVYANGGSMSISVDGYKADFEWMTSPGHMVVNCESVEDIIWLTQ